MSDGKKPHFDNSLGLKEITVGVKQFYCIGAPPPLDHPHVALDMGDDNHIVCPYCSVMYNYDAGKVSKQKH